MPLSKYFGGHGQQVMKDLKAKHGSKAGERIFYATANKRKGKSRRAVARKSLAGGD